METPAKLREETENGAVMVNTDFEPNGEEEAILEVFKHDRQTVNPMYLREQTGLGKGSINTALMRLTSAGWVRKVTRGLYEFVQDPRTVDSEEASPQEPDLESSDDRDVEIGERDVDIPSSEEVDQAVVEAVEHLSESWKDDDRLKNRRRAAAAVLQYALDSNEPIGRSHPIVEKVIDAYPVQGQNEETYWRKNIRAILRELGEYSSGSHTYTVRLEEVENV